MLNVIKVLALLTAANLAIASPFPQADAVSSAAAGTSTAVAGEVLSTLSGTTATPSSTASAAAATATGIASNGTSTPAGNSTEITQADIDNVQQTDVTLLTNITSSNVNFIGLEDGPANATYFTEQVLDFATDPSTWQASHVDPNNTAFSGNFSIAGHLYTPKEGAKQNSTLLVAVHGIGFDSSYWNTPGLANYSLPIRAAKQGYSTFVFDRLATGNSTVPETGGFSVVQAPTELAILQDVLEQLRNTTNVGNQTFDKIALIGHSYGSALSLAISAKAPQLIDNLILTGFSTNTTGQPQFFQAASLTPASVVSQNFSDRPSFYLASGSNTSFVQQFLDPPHYTQEAAELAYSHSQPLTLGELTSLTSIIGPAQNYSGPVFVLNGDADLPFCSRNCSTPSGNFSDQAAAVQQLFPATSNFTSYIVPETGHGISFHPNSVDAYERLIAQVIASDQQA